MSNTTKQFNPFILGEAQVPNIPNGEENQTAGQEIPEQNLKAQGDIIAKQKQEKLELQLKYDELEKQNKAMYEKFNQNQNEQNFSNPQEQKPYFSNDMINKFNEMEQFIQNQKEQEKYQAFVPIKQTLENYNIIGEDQKSYLEQVKNTYGIDLIQNPNQDFLNLLLQSNYNQQPQTLPKGKAFVQNDYNMDVEIQNQLAEQVQAKIKEQTSKIVGNGKFK